MTTAVRLTLDEARIAAAYRSLLAARATTGRCPSAQNIASERDAEATLNRYLERPTAQGDLVLILGIVLIVLALLVPALHVLFWIGVVLAAIGLVLLLLSLGGREVGGRRWY